VCYARAMKHLPLLLAFLITSSAFSAGRIVPPAPPAAELGSLIDLPGSKWRLKEPFFDRMEKHSGREPKRLTIHYTGVPKRSTQTLEQKLHILFDYSVRDADLTAPTPSPSPAPSDTAKSPALPAKPKKPGKKKKAWGDIPYHYYLDLDGKVAATRDPAYQPDSNTKYNRDGHITIVVEGDAKDGITEKQKTKLFSLMKILQNLHKIPLSRVGVHKDYAQTDCPGKEIQDAVLEYKKRESPHVAFQ
jgi:hypothetical protein